MLPAAMRRAPGLSAAPVLLLLTLWAVGVDGTLNVGVTFRNGLPTESQESLRAANRQLSTRNCRPLAHGDGRPAAQRCFPCQNLEQLPYNALVYNRVPKCGSSSTQGIFRQLKSRNNFVYHMAGRSAHLPHTWPGTLWFVPYKGGSTPEFASRLHAKLRAHRNFMIYDMHMRWVNFTNYGFEQPTYINLVRDPVDQFSSAWYYHRGGKAGKPALPNQGNVRQQDKKKLWNWYNTYQTLGKCLEDTAKERLHADEWAALAAITKDMTADQLSEEQARLVASFGEDLRQSPPFCMVVDMPDLINMQTRMFCGFGPECAPGLDQMEQAKLAAERLENEFLIVGLLDKLPQLFRVLETLFPTKMRDAARYATSARRMRTFPHQKPGGLTRLLLEAVQAPDYVVYRRAQELFELKSKCLLGQ